VSVERVVGCRLVISFSSIFKGRDYSLGEGSFLPPFFGLPIIFAHLFGVSDLRCSVLKLSHSTCLFTWNVVDARVWAVRHTT
jgi:hypothetical protein